VAAFKLKVISSGLEIMNCGVISGQIVKCVNVVNYEII
jgi:hypothetical protein